jgi:hypothetical protein
MLLVELDGREWLAATAQRVQPDRDQDPKASSISLRTAGSSIVAGVG